MPEFDIAVGDSIQYTSDDDSTPSGQYKISQILTDSGKISSPGDIVVILNTQGDCSIVEAAELTL